MPHRRPSQLPLGLVAAALASVAVLSVGDAALDLADGAGLVHVGGEGVIVALAVAGLSVLARRIRADRARLEEELARVQNSEAAWRASAARWEEQARAAVRAFGDAVDREFDSWKLTSSEREVALLLLKGMSMKEIAEARGTSERTVRQQAATVYAKSGVEGRAELASYFLDALSLPSLAPAAAAVASSSSSG